MPTGMAGSWIWGAGQGTQGTASNCTSPPGHAGPCGLQEEAVRTLKGAAVLALEVLEVSHMQPPEPLSNAASLLHDHCLLVRRNSIALASPPLYAQDVRVPLPRHVGCAH